jgi:hypothetical protein
MTDFAPLQVAIAQLFLFRRGDAHEHSVQKLPLNDSLRIIISTFVEEEADTAEGTNVSPQRLRDPVG